METLQAAKHTGVKWSGRSRGGLLGNWIMANLVRHVGLQCAYVVLVPVCLYFLLFAPTAVRACQDFHSRIGFTRGGWLSRMWRTYRHFYTFGQILLDRVALIAAHSSRFEISFDGEEHLRSAVQMGKGLVLISAHCGNWEIAAHLLKRLNVPVSVVGYENEIAHIRKYFDYLLKDRYFSVIAMDRSVEGSLKIMNALARGEIVAMHADRHMSPQNQPVQFLGSPARFPTGPYIVAALSGAPLIHSFAMREGAYRYRFLAFPPERLAFTDRKERQRLLREWTSRFAGRLEEILRTYPLQWKNFYDFWEDAQERINQGLDLDKDKDRS